MSKITVRQAAKLTGKSRETINTATKDGTLSFSLNSRNHKVIDIAELERVYPLVKTMDQINEESEAVRNRPNVSESDTNSEIAVLREKLSSVELMKETIVAERERERRQLEEEIETLRSSLEKFQEQHNKALLLITDQSKQTTDRVGDWETSIRKLETRISNQEEKAGKEREKLRAMVRQYKRAYLDEKNKSFWRRLFG